MWDAPVRDGSGFDNIDTNLDTVRLKEVIEMGEGVALLVDRRCKEIIAGISIKDRHWIRGRHDGGGCCGEVISERG